MTVGARNLVRWLGSRSQVEAAKQLGICQSLLSRLLAGSRLPGRRTAILIEQATGGMVSVESWDKKRAA